MRGQVKSSKQLKKYDDTKPVPPKPRKPVSKLVKSPTSRKSKKPIKLPPGQQILSFKPKLMKPVGDELKVICYNEDTMNWPEAFTKKLMHHGIDNDCESDQYIVDREVDKCVASLVEEIAFKKFMELEDTIGF